MGKWMSDDLKSISSINDYCDGVNTVIVEWFLL